MCPYLPNIACTVPHKGDCDCVGSRLKNLRAGGSTPGSWKNVPQNNEICCLSDFLNLLTPYFYLWRL